jgi:hypothetical protein
MTGTDVPKEHRLAEAVVRGLREGAGASDGATAIVEPITRDVPVGNLSHEEALLLHTFLASNSTLPSPRFLKRGID